MKTRRVDYTNITTKVMEGCKHTHAGCMIKCPDSRCPVDNFYNCSICHDIKMERDQFDNAVSHSLN